MCSVFLLKRHGLCTCALRNSISRTVLVLPSKNTYVEWFSIASKTGARFFGALDANVTSVTSGTIPSGVFCPLHELQRLMFPPQTFAHTVTAPLRHHLAGVRVSNRETSVFRHATATQGPDSSFLVVERAKIQSRHTPSWF